MGVEVYRQFDLGFYRFYQLGGSGGGNKPGHVFNTDRVTAHLFQFHCHLSQIFYGVNGAGSIADSTLNVSLKFFGRLNGNFHIAGIIQGIKNPENIYAVFNGQTDKLTHYIICIVAVSHQILPAEKHLEGGIGSFLAYKAQAFPGVFVQEADAGVKGSAAPDLQ